jgi:hypothetical protein
MVPPVPSILRSYRSAQGEYRTCHRSATEAVRTQESWLLRLPTRPRLLALRFSFEEFLFRYRQNHAQSIAQALTGGIAGNVRGGLWSHSTHDGTSIFATTDAPYTGE